MSWVIGGITLPVGPRQVRDKLPADLKSILFPGDLPILLSLGNKARVLTLEGYIAEQGKTASYLETTYVIPLRNKVRTVVTVSAPDTRYDGDYLLAAFECIEKGGFVVSFEYTMELWKGKQYIVL